MEVQVWNKKGKCEFSFLITLNDLEIYPERKDKLVINGKFYKVVDTICNYDKPAYIVHVKELNDESVM